MQFSIFIRVNITLNYLLGIFTIDHDKIQFGRTSSQIYIAKIFLKRCKAFYFD